MIALPFNIGIRASDNALIGFECNSPYWLNENLTPCVMQHSGVDAGESYFIIVSNSPGSKYPWTITESEVALKLQDMLNVEVRFADNRLVISKRGAVMLMQVLEQP